MQIIRASIVIPAFNEEKNLERVLPAVIAQLEPGDEVLVVDNVSRDNTAAVARGFGAKVVSESRRGRGRARNAGFKHSQGEFIVFLDADCLPQKNWLHNLLAPFSDDSVGCVGGEIMNADIETPLGKYLASKGHLSQAVTFAHPFLPFAQTGNIAFRRSVLERVGIFDDRMEEGEDADLCWRMQLESNYRIVCASEALVLHSHDLSLGAFFKQKRRHACGAVLLYKKYRSHRQCEQLTFKKLYWEYHSILRRGLRFMAETALGQFGWRSKPDPERGYQVLVEISEKLGRIEGSLRYRTWYL